jgi:apolipoprotein N-acyltransferase
MFEFTKNILLVFLFSGSLSVAYLDFQYFYLTWFAFVPLLFLVNQKSLLHTYTWGTLAGFCAFSSGMYWIVDFINTAKDSSGSGNLLLATLYWFYCSQIVALLLVLFNWLRKYTNIHEFILFPVLLASMTSLFPMLFSMRLAESQVNFHSALQAIEYFGVYGLDAILALSNIMLFKLSQLFIINRSENKKLSLDNIGARKRNVFGWSVGCLIILAWLVYGQASYRVWNEKVENWNSLKIGIVQPNEVPQLSIKKPYPGFSRTYPQEMAMTERLASLGAELIIWPEANPKQYLNNKHVRSGYQKTVNELDTYLLFQDIKHLRDAKNNQVISRYNSAIMLNPSGAEEGVYNKIKRIPFGEYVPVVSDGSKLNLWLKDYLGSFLNQYTQGAQYQYFSHNKVNIIPLICYETTFPEFVAGAVSYTQSDLATQAKSLQTPLIADLNGNLTNGSLLVGLSNDGWFGSTHQPYQHIMGSILRAVENRLPLVHVANNGPSIVVTPHGKVVFSSEFQQAGGYIAEVPYSHNVQGSFYSQYPRLFITSVWLVTLLVILQAILACFLKPKKTN